MDFGNAGETLYKKFPAIKGVDLEMKSVFYHYCVVADRLNCGPSACMNRQQFVKLFEDAGIFAKNQKSAQLSIIFQQNLVNKEKRLRFENFYNSIADVGCVKWKNEKILKRARSKFHEPGVAIHRLLLDYMLPLSAQVAAVSYSARNRTGAGERRGSDVRAGEWIERWRSIEILREALKAPEILEHFGVNTDDSSGSDTSESDSEDDSESSYERSSKPAED